MDSAVQDNLPMEARLIDIAYRRQPFALLASFAASILLGAALWPTLSQQVLLAWLLSLWLVLGMRYAGWRHYRNAIVHTPDEIAKWRRLAIAGAVASGTIMGLSIYFPALSPHDGVGLLLIIVICGFAAFASSSLAAIPLAAYGFILAAVLPLSFWMFSFGERLHDIMGLFALFYLGILAMLTRQTHGILRHSLDLSDQNHGLVVARQADDLRMQRFFESAPGFFYTSRVRADGSSAMPFASARIHELFGISPEGVSEDITPLLSTCHPDDVAPLLEAKQESSRTLSPFHFEFRIAHPEKGERWIEINSLPLREEGGDTVWHGFMHDVTERKLMETALLQREGEFRTLAENAPDPIYRYDRDCRRIYINQAVGKLTGKPLAALLGKSPIEAIPVPDVNAVEAQRAIQRVLDTGEPGVLEVDFIAANGQRTFIHNALVPEFAADGTVQTVLCIGRDITVHRRIEEVLLRSQVEYSTLAENLPIAVIRYDAAQRRTYINPAAEKMLHGHAEQMLGQVPGEGGVPASPQMIALYRGKMAEVLESGEPREFEFAMDALPKEQLEQYVVRMVPEYGNDGRIAGVLATWFDITGHKQAENALRQSEMKFRTLYDSTGDAVMLLDEAGFFDCNAAALKIFGCATQEEFCANHPADLSPSVQPCGTDSGELANRHIAKAMQEGSHRFEWIHRRADNNESFPAEVLLSAMELDGKPVLQATVRDISERKRMEEELRLKEAVLDQASDSVYLIDENARFVYVNDQACRTLGYSREELLTMGVPDIDHDYAVEDTDAVGKKTREDGSFAFETRHRRSDGSLLPVEIMASALEYRSKHLGLALVRDISERKAMENALRDSEAMLQEAQRIAHVGSWDVDMVNDRLSWSDEIFRIWEIDKTKFRADFAAFLETVHPEDRERVNRVYCEAVENHTLYEVEHRLLFPDGRVKHILERGEPQYDDQGKPVRFIGTSLDITERKRMEETLAARERDFRSLAGNMPDNMARFDTEGRYLYVNPTHEHTLGMKAEDLIGQFIPDSHEQVKAGVMHVAATGQAIHAVRQSIMVNGVEELHDVSLVPEFDETGKVVSVLGIGRDMTERYRMQEALAAREQEFRSLAENMPNNIARWDRLGRYLYINPNLERLFGGSDHVIGKTKGEAFPDGRFAEMEANILNVVATGKKIIAPRQLVPDENGEIRLHDLTLVPEFDAAGQVIGVLGIGHDMTDIYRMQEALAAREQEFRSLAEGAPDNIIRYDREGRTRYLNERLMRQLGLSSMDEVVGKRPGEIWPDGRFAELEATAARVAASGERAELEVQQPDGQGGWMYHLISVVAERNEQGEIVGTIAFGRNITEIKQGAAMLDQERATLRTFFAAMPSLAWMKDSEGRYLACNPMFEQLYGVAEEELVGKTDFDFVDAELAAFFRQKDKEAEAAGKPCFNEEWVTFACDGRRALLETVKSPVFDAEGKVIGVIGVASDITERKRYDAVQQRLSRLAESAPGFMFTSHLRPDGTIAMPYASAAIQQVFGLQPADVEDSLAPLQARIHADDRERVAEIIQKSACQLALCNAEFRVAHPEKGEIWVEARSMPQAQPDGGIQWHGFMVDISERKQTETRQRELERQLQMIADNLPGAFNCYRMRPDLSGGMLYANKGLYDVFGLTLEDLRDTLMPMAERMHPEDLKEAAERMAEASRTLSTFTGEFRVNHPDKGEIWVQQITTPVYESEDSMLYYGMMFDITERKRMADALAERQAFLDSLFEAIPVPVFYKDREGRYQGINRAFETVFGASREQLIGKSVFDTHPRELAETYHAKDAEVFERRVALQQYEYQIKHANGTLRDVLFSKAAFTDAKGEVNGLIGAVIDITERKLTEEALQRSEQLMRTVVDATPDWIFIKDREHRYRLVNRGYADALHLAPEDFIGKTDLELGFPEELVKGNPEKGIRGFWTDDRLVLDSNETQVFPDDPATIDGEVHTFHTIKVPLRDADETPWGVLAFARDISDRKQAEHRLKETLEFSEGVINAIPDLLFEVDREGRYLNIWAQNEELLAAQKELLLGNKIDEMLAPEAAAITMSAIREAEENGLSLGKTICLSLPQGECWFELSVSRKSAGGSGSANFLVLSRDVTERKQYERSLSESRNFLTQIIDGIADPIFVKDREHRWVLCNDAFSTLIGQPREALIGKSDYDFFPREQSDVFWEKDELVFASGETNLNEESINSPDGEVRYIHTKKTPFVTSDGQPLLVGVIRDITERKRIEQALQERGDLLHAVMESSPEIIVFALDANYRYLSFNGKHKQVMQFIWGKEIAVGMNMLDEVIGSQTDREIAKRNFDRALFGESFSEENAYGDEALSREYWQTFFSPIRSTAGEIVGLTCFVLNVSERRRIEEAMRANEEKLSTLFALSPLGIALTDMQGRYVEFNEAFRAICGYPADELMALDYWTLTPREYEAKEGEQLESLAKTGRYGPYEKEYRQKDGTRVPIQLNGVLVTGRDGQQYIWSIVEDITARKQAEAELKAHFERIVELNHHLEENARTLEEQAVELEASQEHLKDALEFTGGVISAIPDILFEMDREGRYLNVWTQNPEVLAAQQAALIGKTVYEILPRETADLAMAAIREADEHGIAYGHTLPIAQLDGEVRWFEHSLAKKRSATPGYPTFIVLSRDITERKKSEAILLDNYRRISDLNDELERSSSALEEKAAELEMQTVELEMSREQIEQTEEWYRSIMHSAPDGMLIVDRRGIIMQTNAQLDALFGYEGGELSGCPVEVLVPDGMREKHVGMRSAFHANPEMRIASAVRNLQGRRKDGTTFPVDISLSRLPDMDGREGAVCAAVRDMSERSKMEAAREQALGEALRLAQMRSVFMAQMSHELRTPLNGILGYAQNLLLGGDLGEKEASGLNVIKHSGEHLLSLINGLLDHAAIEADKFELIPDDIRLEEFLAGLIGIVRVRAEQKNVAFACELEDGLPGMVRGDAQRLRQVLLNLLSNAVKFTDAGKVVLRVQRAGKARMRFEVRDSGVGIAPDQLEKIFLPFEQAGEVSRRAGGSGLGLAISRKLVQLMGGDIRVESRPGDGSTFWFEIDLETVQSDAGMVNAAALAGQAATPVAQPADDLFVPSSAELEVLSGLVQRGSMRDVQRYAEQLRQQDERYGPFAEQLSKLAKSFQTKALRSLIEHYLQARGDRQ